MKEKEYNLEINIFTERRLITNCTIEILYNPATGQQSIGWYRTENSEEIISTGETGTRFN